MKTILSLLMVLALSGSAFAQTKESQSIDSDQIPSSIFRLRGARIRIVEVIVGMRGGLSCWHDRNVYRCYPVDGLLDRENSDYRYVVIGKSITGGRDGYSARKAIDGVCDNIQKAIATRPMNRICIWDFSFVVDRVNLRKATDPRKFYDVLEIYTDVLDSDNDNTESE